MRFVDNPGVLEKFKQGGLQPRVKLCHQRARKTEKEGRKKGREGGRKGGRNESLRTEVAAFVFASHQDERFRALSGVES